MILFLQFKKYEELDIAIYFLTSALIVSIVLSKGGGLRKVLNTYLLKLTGLISYSIYMSHAFIILIFEILLRRFFKKPEIHTPDGKPITSLTDYETLMVLIAILVIVFIVSLLSYFFIEKPMREKSRNYIIKNKN